MVKPAISSSMLAQLREFGGSQLVDRYSQYWVAATHPHLRGWVVPESVVSDDPETRTLFEINLLERPTHLNRGQWVIHARTGHEGLLTRIRSWSRDVRE